jgi:hypothetical protein
MYVKHNIYVNVFQELYRKLNRVTHFFLNCIHNPIMHGNVLKSSGEACLVVIILRCMAVVAYLLGSSPMPDMSCPDKRDTMVLHVRGWAWGCNPTNPLKSLHC